MLVVGFLLLVLVARISAVTAPPCTLTGFFTDQPGGTQPLVVNLELTTQTVNGVAVPNTLSATLPNPKHGLHYTEIGPGSSPQALCPFPALDTNLFKNLGFAYVTPPAAPVNMILWHFYMWGPNQVSRIGSADPGWADCQTWVPPADWTSPGVFLAPPMCIPFMGGHWFPNKMNLFDENTLIPVWGTYNRTVHFYEYASRDNLWTILEGTTDPNGNPTYTLTGTYPLPRWPQVSGWYPASVKIELLGAPSFNNVKMTLYAFQYLTSSADWSAQLQSQFDDGVAEGTDSCEVCEVCDGAFAVTVQFASVFIACLFYFLF